MVEFILEGGVPSLVILVFSVAALVSAGGFAWSPAERKLALIAAQAKVLMFTIALGTFAGMRAVLKAAAHAETREQLTEILCVGTAEALTIGILGFAVLSAVYMLMAVGYRRLKG